jgi:hypothetical protein
LALISRSAVTSAAQQGAAVPSTAVASAAAPMAPLGVVLRPFELPGIRFAEKRAMWSSHREFAGSAGIIMIEGADNTRVSDSNHTAILPTWAVPFAWLVHRPDRPPGEERNECSHGRSNRRQRWMIA